MRHLGTLIAAIVIAPAAWLLLAYGQGQSVQAFADGQADGTLYSNDFVGPAVSLAAAGLLCGLLATLRFSPLGAVVTGLVYAASYLALLIDPRAVLDAFPDKLSLAGRSLDPATPLRTGTALVVGGLMLLGVVSVGRWRRWPSANQFDPLADDLDPLIMGDRVPLGGDRLDPVGPGWGDEPGPYAGRPVEEEPARRNISNWVSALRGDSRSRFVARPSRGPFF